jgi:serine/threonine protein kinase
LKKRPPYLHGCDMISFACPDCGRNLNVRDELGGKKGKCPHCANAIRIPEAAGHGSTNVDQAAETLPPRTQASRAAPQKPGDSGGLPTHGHAASQQETGTDQGPPPAQLVEFLAPPQQPGELGRLAQYRVLRVLGHGGMGVVYKAEDALLKRLVALKVMLPALANNDTARQRFLREARTAAALESDHVVAIHQVGEDRGVPFLAMPFLKGEPLDERIKREGKLSLAETLRIGREAAEGLAAAHTAGLVHRDIKPANLWLEAPKGRVKILDFGLARAVSEAGQLTQQGTVLGTPSYMSPEQAKGQAVDHRCDLFSLGCVLFRMCSGELPFKGKDPVSTIMAVTQQATPAVRQLNPDVPEPLAYLINQLLQKDPDLRPRSALVVAKELEAMEASLGLALTASGKIPVMPPGVSLSGPMMTTGATAAAAPPEPKHRSLLGLITKITAGVFGTLVAPLIVALTIRYVNSLDQHPAAPPATPTTAAKAETAPTTAKEPRRQGAKEQAPPSKTLTNTGKPKKKG